MLVLILAVLGFGSVARGSRRAIDLPFFQFQASELGKVLLVVALAALRRRPLARGSRERDTTARIDAAGARAGRAGDDPAGPRVRARLHRDRRLLSCSSAGTSWQHFAGLSAARGGRRSRSCSSPRRRPASPCCTTTRWTASPRSCTRRDDPGDAGYQQNQSRSRSAPVRRPAAASGATQTTSQLPARAPHRLHLRRRRRALGLRRRGARALPLRAADMARTADPDDVEEPLRSACSPAASSRC